VFEFLFDVWNYVDIHVFLFFLLLLLLDCDDWDCFVPNLSDYLIDCLFFFVFVFVFFLFFFCYFCLFVSLFVCFLEISN
jgi:hypothetical protein